MGAAVIIVSTLKPFVSYLFQNGWILQGFFSSGIISFVHDEGTNISQMLLYCPFSRRIDIHC